MKEQIQEQLPVSVMEKMLGGKQVRVAIAKHPVTGELAPCVPIIDFAEVFSYDKRVIFRMIERTPWLKKFCSVVIMTTEGGSSVNATLTEGGSTGTEGGVYRPHRVMFEETTLGMTVKLQPSRCKDPEVAAHIDQRQEELILLLRDALKGYRTDHNGYRSDDGKLPNPGLSMDAIGSLCREADKHFKGKVSLRALNYFTGMPVDDLIKEMEGDEQAASDRAGVIARYLSLLSAIDVGKYDISKGTTEEGHTYYEGRTNGFFQAFAKIQKHYRLPRVFRNLVQTGILLAKEAEDLEVLGWRRSLARRINGDNIYRFEHVKESVSLN